MLTAAQTDPLGASDVSETWNSRSQFQCINNASNLTCSKLILGFSTTPSKNVFSSPLQLHRNQRVILGRALSTIHHSLPSLARSSKLYAHSAAPVPPRGSICTALTLVRATHVSSTRLTSPTALPRLSPETPSLKKHTGQIVKPFGLELSNGFILHLTSFKKL